MLKPVLRFVHRKACENRLAWLLDNEPPTRLATWTGALVGTFSHVILDALIHHDMRPLAPFSQAQPLLRMLEHDTVYALCAAAAAIGAAVWMLARWRLARRRRLATGSTP